MPTFLLRYHGSDLRLPADRSFVIGRQHDCDLSLAEAGVSRRHAALTVDVRDVQIADLGSRNGILVNGVRIVTATLLQSGDCFSVGSAEFVLRAVWRRETLQAAEEVTHVGRQPTSDDANRTCAVPVHRLRPAESIAQSCRAVLADQGLPIMERIGGVLHLVQALAESADQRSDALVLLGEAVDLLRRSDCGAIPPFTVARIHALLARCQVGDDPAWAARRAELNRVSGMGGRIA
jgi:pSer/pThr/pTyr-binding forkhead associated (FHA) protein